ncbi:b(0,+)-type amino acid transporter 1 [Podila epigama]|nr:b(0,+)-type amino acid transporter 1 [Podila epigama]
MTRNVTTLTGVSSPLSNALSNTSSALFSSTSPSSFTSQSSHSAIAAGQHGSSNSPLFPPSSSSASCKTTSAAPERTMGLVSAVLMIIGTLIGTGIFASPGPLFDSVHCTQTSFIIWAFAGVVCTIGAFAYAELGTMFPESGGDFQYLSRAYGKKCALVFGWSFITILNPIGTAGIAGVLGRYAVDMMIYFRTGTSVGIGGAGVAGHAGMMNGTAMSGTKSFNGTDFVVPNAHSPYSPGAPGYYADSPPSGPMDHTDESMAWVVRGFSIGAIVLMGLINVFFKEGGKYASNILAIFKIAGMMMLIGIGSLQAVKNHAQSEALSIPIRESSHNVLDYVSALCFAFFAYNGFNNINLGLGELRDPERNLKRAVWIAMPFVTILFLLANFAFFSILSSYDLRHVHSLSLHAGHTVLGLPGGFLMAGTVIASALGSINANIWAGSRLLVIMAQDNTIIPFKVSKVWQSTGTQALAILILVGQASFHALINLDFKTFSKIYSAVGWSWYGLSIAGLLYLRKKKPSFPRPMMVYWPLALVFVLVAFFLVFGSLTLAFLGSSNVGGNDSGSSDSGADHGGGRWTSVIMFGGAILFMSGVIPAFYCTRCYNRRKGQKHGPLHPSKESTTDDDCDKHPDTQNNMDPSDHDDEQQQQQVQQHRQRSTEHQLEEGLFPQQTGHVQQRQFNEKPSPSRRHSSASSVTLVDEGRRRRRRQDHLRFQRAQVEAAAAAAAAAEDEISASASASVETEATGATGVATATTTTRTAAAPKSRNRRQSDSDNDGALEGHHSSRAIAQHRKDHGQDSDRENSDTDDDIENNQRGMTRVTRLFTGQTQDGQDFTEEGDILLEHTTSRGSCFSPSGPSTWYNSPDGTPLGSSAPSPSITAPCHGYNSTQYQQDYFLQLPGVRSASRSSETTLGLEGSYAEETKSKEEKANNI